MRPKVILIPGREANPESRDSGFAAARRPGTDSCYHFKGGISRCFISQHSSPAWPSCFTSSPPSRYRRRALRLASGAGHIRQSRFRAGVSRADEHAWNGCRSSCRRSGCLPSTSATRLRPRFGLVWIAGRILYMTGLSQAASEARARLCGSGDRGFRSLAGYAGRDRLAARHA